MVENHSLGILQLNPHFNDAVNKSAQLLLPSMYSATPLPLAHAHVTSSFLIQVNTRSFIQLLEEHHKTSVRFRGMTGQYLTFNLWYLFHVVKFFIVEVITKLRVMITENVKNVAMK